MSNVINIPMALVRKKIPYPCCKQMSDRRGVGVLLMELRGAAPPPLQLPTGPRPTLVTVGVKNKLVARSPYVPSVRASAASGNSASQAILEAS